MRFIWIYGGQDRVVVLNAILFGLNMYRSGLERMPSDWPNAIGITMYNIGKQ